MQSKTFILNKVSNLDKLSCHTYDPEVLTLLNKLEMSHNSICLSKLSQKITYGAGKWELRTTDYVPENYPNRIKLLQISNINENGEIIETNRDKYIPDILHKKWKMSQVKKKDLIVAITGTLGRIALFNGDYEANLNQALGIVRLKQEYNGIKIIPEFIHLYMNSYFAFEQFMRFGGYRAGQSGLSLNEIGSIYIVLPNERRQKEIIAKTKKLKNEGINEHKEFKKYVFKINGLLDSHINLNLKNISKAWVIPSKKIFDRIDCYFNSQELKLLQRKINNLDKKNFEIIKVKDLNMLTAIKKDVFENNKFHIFKYIDIGNTEKNLGEIKNYEEDILLNLPSRSKMSVLTNDLLIPRPIGSTQGIIKIQKNFNNQFFSTGNIQIRPKNEQDAFLLWAILKSDIIQKQFFYLQSGSSQPEITPKNFKKYILIPIPKGEIRETIIKNTKKYYKIASEHKKNAENKKKEMYEIFKQELQKEL